MHGLREAIAELAARIAGDSAAKGTIVPKGAFGDLAAAFDLEPIDLELLVVASAPELDGRVAELFGGRVSVGRALDLVRADPWDPTSRARLQPGSPLIRWRLLEIDGADRPFPERLLRTPDRVVGHLLGDDEPDARVRSLLSRAVPADLDGVDDVASAIASGIRLCWIHEAAGTAGSSLAAAACARVGITSVIVDLDRLAAGGLSDVYAEAVREAALRRGGLVVHGVKVERDGGVLRGIDAPPCPVILVGDRPWDPMWSTTVPFIAEAVEAPFDARRAVWGDAIRRLDIATPSEALGLETFRLVPEQIVASAIGAVTQAIGSGGDVTAEHLLAGVRAQNAGRLERLATRIEPRATFDTLILRDDIRTELESIIHRAHSQELVRERWGMGGGGARRGRGISCLFAGTSGTGKTLAAEVIAHELGVDLFTIDLSQVVDKYIGETEKNLERIFSQAEGMNAVLFFDEADALFGKRSDVQSAHDRHANVEVAYLLQRMERFNGVAILATNLRGNLDDAFTRRIDVICHFPEPDESERERLWWLHLPPTLPMDDDIDVPVLAKAVDVSGGVIRNITMSAAYQAAADGRPVDMGHLIASTQRELRKMGRLVRAADFGPYAGVIDDVPSEEHEGGRGG